MVMGAAKQPPSDAVAVFLKQTALLRGCPAEVIQKLAQLVEHRTVPAGQSCLPVGGVGFLLAGRISLRVASGATAVTVEELGVGDCFGEIGFLLSGVHAVSAVAEDNAHVVLVRKEHFEHLFGVVPGVAQALARRVAALCGKLTSIAASATAPPEPAAPPEPEPAGLRFVETSEFAITPALLDMLPSRLVLEHRALPLEARGNTLLVGMVNPTSVGARQELRRVLHTVDPEIVAISADDFNQAIARLKLDVRDRSAAATGARVKPAYAVDSRRDSDKHHLVIGDEAVALFDRILVEGVERGASDIHIEAEPANVRVRYRVQGMLFERQEPLSLAFFAPLVARTKVLAELDITERRLPQDGRLLARIGKREINFRISTLAAARGEKVVIRILDPADVMRPLPHIFVDSAALELVEKAVAAPHGAIVVAGPTGSGKSSTLYAMINQRRAARPDNNIVTVEDPVEYSFPGITQVQVHPKIGLDHPTVLRALLRQDPDVIGLGELRDAATAAICIEASLTGHVVLTTFHASTAMAALQRLEHLGSDRLLLAQALNVLVVQRLARRLCPACVREEDVSPALLDNLIAREVLARGAAPRLPRPVGCAACDHTGYRGRLAVTEILSFQDNIRGLLASDIQIPDMLVKAAETGQFLPFARSVRLLIARKLLAPADALLVMAT